MVHCFTDETGCLAASGRTGGIEVTEHIWETFDDLFKTVHRQGRRVEELESRLAELEKRLTEATTAEVVKQPSHPQPFAAVNEMPAERAA